MEGINAGGEYLTKEQLLKQLEGALFEAFTRDIPDLESKLRVKAVIRGFIDDVVAKHEASELFEKFSDPDVSIEAFFNYLQDKGLVEEETQQ
jgi:hypothetical protein